jgi:hypothetical protein
MVVGHELPAFFLSILGVAALGLIGGKAVTRPSLTYFKASEFGIWWPLMNADLLLKLDAFRERWGAPVVISSAQGALGRHAGGDNSSQHNVDKWGEVKAVDVFPMVSDGEGGYRYMSTASERQRAYDVALAVGFNGIGLYTDTKPGDMLHVDVRDAAQVALWSRVEGDYFGIQQVLS